MSGEQNTAGSFDDIMVSYNNILKELMGLHRKVEDMKMITEANKKKLEEQSTPRPYLQEPNGDSSFGFDKTMESNNKMFNEVKELHKKVEDMKVLVQANKKKWDELSTPRPYVKDICVEIQPIIVEVTEEEKKAIRREIHHQKSPVSTFMGREFVSVKGDQIPSWLEKHLTCGDQTFKIGPGKYFTLNVSRVKSEPLQLFVARIDDIRMTNEKQQTCRCASQNSLDSILEQDTLFMEIKRLLNEVEILTGLVKQSAEEDKLLMLKHYDVRQELLLRKLALKRAILHSELENMENENRKLLHDIKLLEDKMKEKKASERDPLFRLCCTAENITSNEMFGRNLQEAIIYYPPQKGTSGNIEAGYLQRKLPDVFEHLQNKDDMIYQLSSATFLKFKPYERFVESCSMVVYLVCVGEMPSGNESSV